MQSEDNSAGREYPATCMECRFMKIKLKLTPPFGTIHWGVPTEMRCAKKQWVWQGGERRGAEKTTLHRLPIEAAPWHTHRALSCQEGESNRD